MLLSLRSLSLRIVVLLRFFPCQKILSHTMILLLSLDIADSSTPVHNDFWISGPSRYPEKKMARCLTDKQVISKQRVADHGEVLTGKREVNAMLDLVKQETERIESRFLEPACGTGNFLTEILERKLHVVDRRYRRSHVEHGLYDTVLTRKDAESVFKNVTR